MQKFVENIIKKIQKYTKVTGDDPASLSLRDHINPGIRIGSYIIFAFIGFFIIWGGIAPIDSAVISQGVIVPVGKSKNVQHLQGGIIEKIIVTEGKLVKKGDPLIELSKTQAKSRLQVLKNQYYTKKLTEIRINAELLNKDYLDIDSMLDDAIKENDLQKIYDSEVNLLKFNLSTFKGQEELYNQQLVITEDMIKGIKDQLESLARQKSLVQEELNSVNILLAKKLVQKTRVLALERNKAELDGKISEYNSQLNRYSDTINETKIKIEQLKQNKHRELNTELKTIHEQIASLKEEIDAAKDIEDRTMITAQEDGVVTNLKYHSIGGIIPPGGVIMEIVPLGENLEIEARILPQDIDVVSENQKAKILLSAFKARFIPRINGVVKYIAADKTIDERTGQSYFLAKISIDYDEVKKLGKTLLPGMPAEVFIVTGEHTFLEYFLSPIINSFRHSMHE